MKEGEVRMKGKNENKDTNEIEKKNERERGKNENKE